MCENSRCGLNWTTSLYVISKFPGTLRWGGAVNHTPPGISANNGGNAAGKAVLMMSSIETIVPEESELMLTLLTLMLKIMFT